MLVSARTQAPGTELTKASVVRLALKEGVRGRPGQAARSAALLSVCFTRISWAGYRQCRRDRRRNDKCKQTSLRGDIRLTGPGIALLGSGKDSAGSTGR